MIRALPDLLSTSLFSRGTSDLRNNLDRAAIEAVTGKQSDLTAAAAGQNGQVHRAQMAVDQSQATQTRLALTAGRYTSAAAAYEAVRKGTENVGVDALQAATSGDRAGIVATANTAESTLGLVFGALNTRFDGRSLFAGDAASNPSLSNLDTLLADMDAIATGSGTTADKLAAVDAYFAPGGTFDTSIYTGGTGEAAPVVLPDGTELPPIENANSDAFRDMMKGLAITAQAYKLPPVDYVDWVRQGADLIRSAQDELVVSEAALGDTVNRIEDAVETENDQLRLAAETLDRIIGRDAFESASEVQDFEARLQAAYTLTSRLGQLSLTNYLR